MFVEKEVSLQRFLSPVGTVCQEIRSGTCRPSETQQTGTRGILVFYTHSAPTELKTGISVIFQRVFGILLSINKIVFLWVLRALCG